MVLLAIYHQGRGNKDGTVKCVCSTSEHRVGQNQRERVAHTGDLKMGIGKVVLLALYQDIGMGLCDTGI